MKGMTITGDQSLAFAFKEMAVELEGEGYADACREAAEEIVRTYREIAPRNTGAMADAARTRPVGNGSSGWEAYISRDDLVAEREKRGAPVPYDKKRGESYFYAAEVEFGAKAPLRTAADKVADRFIAAVARETNRITGA